METYELAQAAVNRLFGDTSVSRSETKRLLNELIGEIEIMVEALEADEARELSDVEEN
jgi:polyhydroxyalkanoate synthesis regulator phasin